MRSVLRDQKEISNIKSKRLEEMGYLKRNFILDNYNLSTLARGLKEPSITYANHKTSIDDIKEALKKEMDLQNFLDSEQ